MNKNMHHHSENSSYREKLIEHIFISELLKLSWIKNDYSLEISKPEVDNSGYDIIAESSGVTRHIQLKASHITSTTARQNIHIKLAQKPSGCVVWIHFNDNLELSSFRFFGNSAGYQLPDLSDFKTAKHTKGNKDGVKNERPQIKIIEKRKFDKPVNIEELYRKLFITTDE